MKIAIIDIDGVIADCSHRLHHINKEPPDWPAFFDAMNEDTPIRPTVNFVQLLRKRWAVVYLTGRPESHRVQTVNWLKKYDLWFHPEVLLMRSTGDYRPDHVIKKEIYQNDRGASFHQHTVSFVLEDRQQVVDMWRGLGLLCLQPKNGDY